MRIVAAKDSSAAEVKKLLRKPAFDEIELPDFVRQANSRIFGADLSAAEIVRRIVGDVRKEGDAALIRYAKMIDNVELSTDNMAVTQEEFSAAEADGDPRVVAALKKAIDNVRRYHEEQKSQSWWTTRSHGAMLGQMLVPLSRVGLYVPAFQCCCPFLRRQSTP